MLHHVLGLTYEEIIERDAAALLGADEADDTPDRYDAASGRSPSAISQAVNSLYDVLGLSRRSAP